MRKIREFLCGECCEISALLVEDEITEIESSIRTIPDKMAQFGTDYVKLGELQKEQEQLETQLDEKMTRWSYLSEIVEG